MTIILLKKGLQMKICFQNKNQSIKLFHLNRHVLKAKKKRGKKCVTWFLKWFASAARNTMFFSKYQWKYLIWDFRGAHFLLEIAKEKFMHVPIITKVPKNLWEYFFLLSSKSFSHILYLTYFKSSISYLHSSYFLP